MLAQLGFEVWAPTQALFVCAPRHLGNFSGRSPTQGFRCGSQATDWDSRPLGHFGSNVQAAELLIRVRARLEFQLCAPSPLIWVPASRTSGDPWGCFSLFTVQGLRG